MKLTLIGDIHGKFQEYYYPIISRLDKKRSIQVGDMGLGFPSTKDEVFTPPRQHKFIRGNHDNPEVCRKHPNYLGDFGYIEKWDLFYVSGAWSIDRKYRIEGSTWWSEEELGMKDSNDALKLYMESKPRIMITHDCPEIAKINTLTHIHGENPNNIPTRTNQLFQAMFEFHKPSYWFFGHYHVSHLFQIHNTQFRCLGEGEEAEIDL